MAASAHSDSDRDFWAGIEQGNGRSISEFPWRKNGCGPETLDDLLLLTLIHQPAAVAVISRATDSLTGSVKPRQLSELVAVPEGEKKRPLLLLSDPDQLLCELNMLLLQDELQRISGVSWPKIISTHVCATFKPKLRCLKVLHVSCRAIV